MSDSSFERQRYDVIIVGAGPAGLSAALVLGRCRRRVLLCDAGKVRNADARAAHGFLTRDGTPPEVIRRIAFEQLEPYDVEVVTAWAEDVAMEGSDFVVRANGRHWVGRKLLLATGMRDREPEVPGARELIGAGVYHCPYCDGWELRDQPLGSYAPGCDGPACALALLTWSRSVTLFTDGPAALGEDAREQLHRNGIPVVEEPIESLERTPEGALRGVRLVSGGMVPIRALFAHAGQEQRSSLAHKLGCEFDASGAVLVAKQQRTTRRGLYVAGDAAANVQSIAIAVAEGYAAATGINQELREEDFP